MEEFKREKYSDDQIQSTICVSNKSEYQSYAINHLISLFFLILLSISLTHSLHAQDQIPVVAVDSLFTSMDTPTSPGCALSIMRDGAPIYEKGYGMANLEYGIPITPNSVFHIASVSKQFTAMAVELLVNEGKISWDDDIRKYVPEVPNFNHKITLRHLVHHVSGIRDQWNLLNMAGWRWEADLVTQEDVLDIISRQKNLNFEPGSRYMYSNTGFTLLAVVVERVTGKAFRQFTKDRIFMPLGMENTHFHDDHQMIVQNRAWAYEPDKDGVFGLKNSIPDFAVVGATSLFTTVHDMTAWDRNFYSETVGGKEAVDRLQERFVLSSGDTISYAHGMGIGEYRGLRTVEHGGADAGYRSHFLRFPDQQFSVAVFCNISTANPGDLAKNVADIYLFDDLQAQKPNTVKKPESTEMLSTEKLKELAGIYVAEPGDRTVYLQFKRDTLWLANGPFALHQVDKNRFEVMGIGLNLTINPPTNEHPATIIPPENVDDDTYVRRESWTPTNKMLDSFAGTYYSPELETIYRFAHKDSILFFEHRKLASKPLKPTFEDAFLLDGKSIVFTRNEHGNIDGFRISSGRVWNVQFYRESQ